MLQYLNVERTEMQFGETFVSLLVAGDLGSIGDGPTRDAVLTYVEAGGIVTDYQPPPVVISLPALTRRQLRLALLSIGITTEQIEAIIAATPDATDRATAWIEWQDANAYERHHPLIDDIAAAIMVPADQIDALLTATAAPSACRCAAWLARPNSPSIQARPP